MNTEPCLYRHILVGLDLSDEAPLVLHKAARIAQACAARISIAHVLEPISFAYGGDMPVDLSEVEHLQLQNAQQFLQNLAQNSPVPIQQQHVLVGQAASELHYLAQQEGADLIIIGSHGRKGIALLLGSTPNSVLHGATCDVLAVWVQGNSANN
ncbi:MAG TPA: universal stress protein [Cellvibrio sp.]|nr:universal stress protein [Cellvibrio sp.]